MLMIIGRFKSLHKFIIFIYSITYGYTLRMEQLELSNLQTFVTVAETGSFSQTSEQLFLTQPAISKRIAALEKELGTRLFDRIGRHVDLTEAGTALLPRARQILMQVEDSRRAISNLTGQITGKLSIGTSHHIGLHRLPPILRQFSSQ